FEAVPSRLAYDYRAVKDETLLDRQDQQMAFTAPPGGGMFYVLVYADEVGTLSEYNLSATTGPFVVTSITPDHGSNRTPDQASYYLGKPFGRVIPETITVSGAGFDAATTVEFIAPDHRVRTPKSSHFVSSTTLTLDLDLTTWVPGSYNV